MMVQEKSNIFKQALWQIPMLIALAFLIAVGSNQWRANGIPLVGDWSADARFSDAGGESIVIAIEQARQLFAQDEALFVDSRPENQYAQGHIRGALNLPWQDVDRYFVEIAVQLEEQKRIIAYCDGEACDLSHEVALFLKEMGFKNVWVLVNGWTVWQQAGLPINTGGGNND